MTARALLFQSFFIVHVIFPHLKFNTFYVYDNTAQIASYLLIFVQEVFLNSFPPSARCRMGN